MLVPDPFPELVNVTLISADQSPLYPELGNVSSQITVLVTAIHLINMSTVGMDGSGKMKLHPLSL